MSRLFLCPEMLRVKPARRRQVGRAGVVRVSQLRARRLPAMDSNGRADPFVLMRTGEGMAQRVGAATRRRALKASLRELEADGDQGGCHARPHAPC